VNSSSQATEDATVSAVGTSSATAAIVAGTTSRLIVQCGWTGPGSSLTLDSQVTLKADLNPGTPNIEMQLGVATDGGAHSYTDTNSGSSPNTVAAVVAIKP
jgi:hypothetical protein